MCKRYHLSRRQPLSHRWFLIKDIKALVCPFAVLRSRFGLRYSCVRGRRQSKFLASSSTGGARNFYPCTGEPRFALRSPQRSLTQGSREERSVRLAEDREPRALPRRAQICRGGTTPSKCAATRGTSKHFAQRAKYFTRAERVFHRAAGAISHGSEAAVYHCGGKAAAHSLLQPFGTKKSL